MFLGIILMIESKNATVLGPSNRESDIFRGDSEFERRTIMDAAPMNLNILNCRKTNRSNHGKYEVSISDKGMGSLFHIHYEKISNTQKHNLQQKTCQIENACTRYSSYTLGFQIDFQKFIPSNTHATFQYFTRENYWNS